MKHMNEKGSTLLSNKIEPSCSATTFIQVRKPSAIAP